MSETPTLINDVNDLSDFRFESKNDCNEIEHIKSTFARVICDRRHTNAQLLKLLPQKERITERLKAIEAEVLIQVAEEINAATNRVRYGSAELRASASILALQNNSEYQDLKERVRKCAQLELELKILSYSQKDEMDFLNATIELLKIERWPGL